MTVPLDERHKALLRVFFYGADGNDLLGLRQAMLKAALQVQDKWMTDALNRFDLSMETRAEVQGAMHRRNEELIKLICS